MKRRVMIAGVVALALVAGFGLFLRKEQPAALVQQDTGTQRVQKFISRSTTQPEKVIEGGDLRLTPGDRTFAVIYDRVTGEPKYQFRAERWEPVSDSEFRLTRPELRVHMPDGQMTYVRANEGQVILASSGRRSVEPKRGWLKGDVRVTMDRTTRKWRAAHPKEVELEQHQDQVINIFLADVNFDLEQAWMESNGPLRVQSVEADVDGDGLRIAWNQVDNRVDSLLIRKGKRMELRRGGGMVDFAMPGSQRTAKAEPAARQRGAGTGKKKRGEAAKRAQVEAVEVARARPMSAQSVGPTAAEAAATIRALVSTNRPMTTSGPIGSAAGANVASAAKAGGAGEGGKDLAALADTMVSEARRGVYRGTNAPLSEGGKVRHKGEHRTGDEVERAPRIDTYSAVFVGNVVVEQRQGMRRPGRMTCDKLELIFDFGKKQKQSAFPKSDAPTTGPAEGRKQRRSVEPKTPQPEDATRLILTWEGPLEMRPLNIPAESQTQDRFDAIASGRQVDVNDERGEVHCKQLVYRNATQQVWLSGSETEPVVMANHEERPAGEGEVESVPGRLTGHELFFDRHRGVARIDGDGEMTRPTSGGKRDAANAGGLTEGVESAEGASIRWTRGVEIEMKQSREKLHDPATGETKEVGRDYLSRAWFHGDVHVVRKGETISGEDVAATFAAPTRRGASTGPIAHLDVTGRVLMERGVDRITGDRVDIDFDTSGGKDSVPRSALATGRVTAIQGRRKITGDEIAVKMTQIELPPDRTRIEAARRAGREPTPRRELAMTEIHARRGVVANDPEQHFAVRAEELDAVIHDGRHIDTATIVGARPDELARVHFQDFTIWGHRIDADMAAQTADVPGAGRARFTTDRDLGGGELAKSEKVNVSWSTSMRVRGRENNAVFEGDVRSETPTYRVGCDRMVVTLADVPVGQKTNGKRGAGGTGKGLMSGWADGAAGAMLSEMMATWTGRGREPTKGVGKVAAANTMSQKRPIRVQASGKVVAIRTVRQRATNRLLTRSYMAGDEFDVDLRKQSMNIPGRGTLLMEDYEIQRGKRRESGAGRPSLLGVSEPPSQTRFDWANGMSYFVEQSLLTFDRQVEMRHVSGQSVVLKEDLVAAMKVDPTKLKLPPGRHAELSCDNLLVQFLRNPKQQSETMDARGAELKQLVASGSVHLQEDTKSIMGERISYSRDTNRLIVNGSEQFEARIFDQDEATQHFTMWRGPVLTWDRATNRIESPEARVVSSGR